jgi:hypothetical protein
MLSNKEHVSPTKIKNVYQRMGQESSHVLDSRARALDLFSPPHRVLEYIEMSEIGHAPEVKVVHCRGVVNCQICL